MDARELFLLRYDDIHGGFVDELFSDLTDAQIRQRPGGVNSIAWLVWHVARVQDAVVSRFVLDRPQVLDEGDWNRLMRIERRDVGSGMASHDVDALSAAVEVAALRGYHRAVAGRTKDAATSLAPAACNHVIAPLRACMMTCWIFIARSTAAAANTMVTPFVDHGFSPDGSKSGHLTCSRGRTDHVLPTLIARRPGIETHTLKRACCVHLERLQ